MSGYPNPRLSDGDVVDLIISDHRRFEELLRTMRDSTADRAAARRSLAELIIAHGESEEAKVYSRLKKTPAIGEHEAEHGEEEHAEINQALLDLLEIDAVEGEDFDEAVEELATAVNHHINEEEQTILDPARTEVDESLRTELGSVWTTERNRLLDQGCASVEQVRAIVEQAKRDGTLDDD